MSGIPAPGGNDVLAALKGGRIQDPDARIRAATQLLESSFYEELFKVMRETVPDGGVTSGGSGEDVFHSLMDQNIATAAAQRQERGLGQALYRYFTQGTRSPHGTPAPEAAPADAPLNREVERA